MDQLPIMSPAGGIVAVLLTAVLALVVRAVIKGDLVPRRTHEDILRDRDEWREATRTSEQARAEGQAQVAELLEHARTTDAFIRSVSQVAGGSP